MNIAETLRSLWRRWYISLPGLLLAGALAVGVWTVQTPQYQRTATQMLLPGSASVPDGANPYIYIGGLTQAADVVVRALGARDVARDVVADRPGAQVQVTRDPSASGPMILITVTARSDADAAAVLGETVARTDEVLEQLQDEESIPASSRIKVIEVAVDGTSVLQQRERTVLAGAAGLGATLFALVLAVTVDGLVVARTRRADRSRPRAQDGAGPRAGAEADESTDRDADPDDPDVAVDPGSGPDPAPDPDPEPAPDPAPDPGSDPDPAPDPDSDPDPDPDPASEPAALPAPASRRARAFAAPIGAA